MKKWIAAAAGCMLLAAGMLGYLVYNGYILLNGRAAQRYEVRGVDVSAWQGEINWAELAAQGIDFAFIKASEGSSHVDGRFEDNWEGAGKTGIRIGAYHFFSYDSPGSTQADNFVSTVPAEDMLPPVVDVEFYGDKEKHPPQAEDVERELRDMLARLEAHYGMRPILYATEKSYRMFLAGRFEGYDIWIRNVIGSPELSDGRAWTFWQYTNRARMAGFSGKEKYIDVNVFAGTTEEFAAYGRQGEEK